jgi:hypothetical protein
MSDPSTISLERKKPTFTLILTDPDAKSRDNPSKLSLLPQSCINGIGCLVNETTVAGIHESDRIWV